MSALLTRSATVLQRRGLSCLAGVHHANITRTGDMVIKGDTVVKGDEVIGHVVKVAEGYVVKGLEVKGNVVNVVKGHVVKGYVVKGQASNGELQQLLEYHRSRKTEQK